MTENTFQAMVVRESEPKTFTRAIEERSIGDLPPADVLVRVNYSSLNYKDALSATGNKGVTRNFPHTPGIDAAGVVASSDNPEFSPGDNVIVTSYDLGMNTPGDSANTSGYPVTGWCLCPEPSALKRAWSWERPDSPQPCLLTGW